MRVLQAREDQPAVAVAWSDVSQSVEPGWLWIDVLVGDDAEPLIRLADELGLDQLGVRDAIHDGDLPKVDDFDDHLLVVFHGLSEDEVTTYQVNCFLTDTHLLTVHRQQSPSIDALWEHVQRSMDLSTGRPDELLARLADVLTQRHMAVIEVFDRSVDDLIDAALAAEPTLIADLTTMRSELARVRRIVQPQREALDVLRRTTSPLISPAGQRRFADVFDLASRTAHGFDAARTALAEVLDAYRGAEARKATEVTKVLTVYAAIMLPLSLIAGIFGMNFANLPARDSDRGWIIAAGAMVVVLVGSLVVFAALGWIRLPSGRKAGSLLGRGLVEAARSPVKLVSTVVDVSRRPASRTRRRSSDRST